MRKMRSVVHCCTYELLNSYSMCFDSIQSKKTNTGEEEEDRSEHKKNNTNENIVRIEQSEFIRMKKITQTIIAQC